jgi:hypothetical protein
MVMPLTFDDDSALDRFNRCKQQAALLDQEVTNDGFIRFADYAWHLRDWLLGDPTVPQAAKDEVLSWKTTPPCLELCICKDIINTDKHLEITRYDPPTKDVSSQRGYGSGRYGKGGYGMGEKEISITMSDGTVFNALDVVHAVVGFWEEFIARHLPEPPIYPQQRL